MSLAIVRAAGVKVIEVVDLGPDARYLPSLNILLVEADLDQDARDRVGDRVLDLEGVWTQAR